MGYDFNTKLHTLGSGDEVNDNPYKCHKCGHQLAAVGTVCPCQVGGQSKDYSREIYKAYEGGSMKKRNRKYRCPSCKQEFIRMSDKKRIPSDCEIKEKRVYLKLVKDGKK